MQYRNPQAPPLSLHLRRTLKGKGWMELRVGRISLSTLWVGKSLRHS
jgi:hypothetical protein